MQYINRYTRTHTLIILQKRDVPYEHNIFIKQATLIASYELNRYKIYVFSTPQNLAHIVIKVSFFLCYILFILMYPKSYSVIWYTLM